MRGIGFLVAMAFQLSVPLAGCGAPDETAPMEVVGPPVTGADDLVIGEEGMAEYQFGSIQGIAVDPNGNVYVSDQYFEGLRVFDPEGRFLQDIGRRGNGPGEFSNPLDDVVFGPDGRLYVMNPVHINVFARNDTTGVWDRWEERWDFRSPTATFRRKTRVDGELRVWLPVPLDSPDSIRGQSYFLALPARRDSIRVPAYANLQRSGFAHYMTRPGSGRMVPWLSAAPFEASPSWDLTPEGTILGGEGDRYVLYETNAAGDTLRIIRRDRPPLQVPEMERADSLRALRARLDALPVPRSAVRLASPMALAGEVGEEIPAYVGVNVLDDGTIWVEVWPTRPGTRRFDVLDPTGEWTETIEVETALSRAYPLVFAGDKIYGVLEDPVTEVQRVGRATIQRETVSAGP